MALDLYRRKRDFKITPEPRGRVAKRRGAQRAFFVQKHAARRLHYDFRLELDGVLLSWAVPKGPSLDPRDKRLAVHVEDHPMEYGDFEGVIPPKQYGAGAVLLWDRGTWQPVGDAAQGYARGRLKFVLEGEKLRGGWTLVRTRGRYARESGTTEPWLLIKEDDAHARSATREPVVDAHPDSVTSGRSIAEIAADPDREWHSDRSVAENVRQRKRAPARRRSLRAKAARIAGAVAGELPERVEPQLATLVKDAPVGSQWLHELKHDGYRMLCRVAGGEARLVSRSGRDWTETFASVARLALRLPLRAAWLDGEVVVLDRDGRSSFQTLQNTLASGRDGDFVYFVFDLLHLDGYDLRGAALRERKALLEALLAKAPAALRYSTHVVGSGGEFFSRLCALEVEGMVSKRVDARYTAGRGRDWVKVKCSRRQELVIVGYTDATSGRGGLGALHLGIHQPDGTLRYAGKVGTGFTAKAASHLLAQLEPLVVARPQLGNAPRGAEARRSHWVRPELVAEVEFTEWTDDGTLRHPSFKGLRADKAARDVVEERAEPAPVGRRRTARGKASPGDVVVAGVAISNPDKLLYPDVGLTKRDLALFYEEIGRWIVAHVRNRPLTLVRCPNGWQQKCFYQKSAAGSHPALDSVEVQTGDGPADYLVANSVEAVVATLQMGALELHPWGSTADALDRVDRITFDLDPDDGLGWEVVVEAAVIVRTLLEKLGLVSFVKTTGGKGLHVVLPVEPTLGWDDVKGFCKTVADLLCTTFPDRFTPSITKAARRGRIFIDYLRNAEGATAVAAYSLRARAQAPVAMPLAWDELKRTDVRFAHFNVANVPRRLARRKRDPWQDFFAVRQSITRDVMEQVGYVPGRGAAAPDARRRGRWRR